MSLHVLNSGGADRPTAAQRSEGSVAPLHGDGMEILPDRLEIVPAMPPAVEEFSVSAIRRRMGLRPVREIAIVVSIWLTYEMGRFVSRADIGEALDNARSVLHFERALSFANEQMLQEMVLDNHGLVRFLNGYYAAAHFPFTIAFMVWAFMKHPEFYRRFRRLLTVITLSGLVIHMIYPLAPPRMLSGSGFVDTITQFGPSIYENDAVKGVANQFAAMPSLHFGWAALVAWGVISTWRSRWRWLALLHPVFTLVAIVLTANHFWLDAIIAGMIVAAGLLFTRWRLAHSAPDAELDSDSDSEFDPAEA